MADKKIDLSALAQAIDTTWGRSSTPKVATQSVKLSIEGTRLVAKYQAVVNMGTEHERVTMRRRYAEESIDAIAAVIKRVKEDYRRLAGSALTTKEASSRDSLEIVGASPHSPRRTAMYRRCTVLDLS